MAGAQLVLALPYKANEALTKHRFVKLAADEAVDMCDTEAEGCLGVVDQNVSTAEAALGKSVGVQVLGVVWVEAGAAITRGDKVQTSSAGKALTATTGDIPLGIALKGAAADGDLIPVFLTPGHEVI